MAFNVALTGLRAASVDLEVTGNNVANASTVGFKRSRVEFGDLYSNSFLTGSINQIGDGVRVQKINQNFGQANLTYTDNNLDLGINGQGFFVLNNGGTRQYSRAGAFGLDTQGYVVNNTGMRLQGYMANEQGVIGGGLTDLVIDADILDPRRTTDVSMRVNLDSQQVVLAKRGVTLSATGSEMGRVVAGTGNGVSGQILTLTLPNGTTRNLEIGAGQSANAIASAFNALDGFDASAITQASILSAGFNNASGNMRVSINGVPFEGIQNLSELAQAVNNSPSLTGLRASISNSGDLVLTDNRGYDIRMEFAGEAGDSFSVLGPSQTTPLVLDANTPQATATGTVNLVMKDGISLSSTTDNLFNDFDGVPFVTNTFDPLDPATYNHTTSTTIYDSLGNAHVLSMYFVKEDLADGTGLSLWTMYTQIDGRDVGDPVTPGGDPTRASFRLVFNADGSLNETLSDDVLISNWTPLDANGRPNGAEGPQPVADGGTLPIPYPPTSSNFQISLDKITQWGSAFSVNDMQQNGYTTGRLSGLDVNNDGIIFARYTNGESKVLGQVALAHFTNQEGLASVGETTWVETYMSGAPIIGMPGSSVLGHIRSNSLEDSNVDLSEQLVNLIIAQRNYQANAKTIETANAVTQTIINLR